MRTWVLLGMGVVCLLCNTPSSLGDEIHRFLQPVESQRDLVLESRLGDATIQVGEGRRQALPLRADERLTAILETEGGWTAGGVREHADGSDLFIIRRQAAGLSRLSPPGQQRHDLRLRPVLLPRQQDLGGVAWLEGSDLTSLSVRAAVQESGTWDEVTIVAPPGKGSQTGLVGTRLAGGDWLLVWAAFDGTDDELLWSRGNGRSWSPPRRLSPDNSVPDVLPALATTERGALASWSRLVDGQFQLQLARFDGESWSQPIPVGTAGTLDATFVRRNGHLHLLFQQAWPAGWTVAELDSRGRLERFAVIAVDSPHRPELRAVSGQSVELRWPDRGQRSASWEIVP